MIWAGISIGYAKFLKCLNRLWLDCQLRHVTVWGWGPLNRRDELVEDGLMVGLGANGDTAIGIVFNPARYVITGSNSSSRPTKTDALNPPGH